MSPAGTDTPARCSRSCRHRQESRSPRGWRLCGNLDRYQLAASDGPRKGWDWARQSSRLGLGAPVPTWSAFPRASGCSGGPSRGREMVRSLCRQPGRSLSPAAPPGVRLAPLGPWHSGRWLPRRPCPLSPPLPPPAQRLPQEIPPLPPPAGSGAEGPSRPRSRAVSQRPRPRPQRAGPAPVAPVRTRGAGWIGACAQVNRSGGTGGEPSRRCVWAVQPGRHGAVGSRLQEELPGVWPARSQDPPWGVLFLHAPRPSRGLPRRPPRAESGTHSRWPEQWCHLADGAGAAHGAAAGTPPLRRCRRRTGAALQHHRGPDSAPHPRERASALP